MVIGARRSSNSLLDVPAVSIADDAHLNLCPLLTTTMSLSSADSTPEMRSTYRAWSATRVGAFSPGPGRANQIKVLASADPCVSNRGMQRLTASNPSRPLCVPCRACVPMCRVEGCAWLRRASPHAWCDEGMGGDGAGSIWLLPTYEIPAWYLIGMEFFALLGSRAVRPQRAYFSFEFL